jgi:hypothetical protein
MPWAKTAVLQAFWWGSGAGEEKRSERPSIFCRESWGRFKFEIPSSRFQTPKKLQLSNPKRARLIRGSWILILEVSLKLGVWSLEFGTYPRTQNSIKTSIHARQFNHLAAAALNLNRCNAVAVALNGHTRFTRAVVVRGSGGRGFGFAEWTKRLCVARLRDNGQPRFSSRLG